MTQINNSTVRRTVLLATFGFASTALAIATGIVPLV
jgi:hypothetical protein